MDLVQLFPERINRRDMLEPQSLDRSLSLELFECFF